MTKSRGIRTPRTPWTEPQVEEIRRRYPHEKTETIAADLGLPVARVYSKAAWMMRCALLEAPEPDSFLYFHRQSRNLNRS